MPVVRTFVDANILISAFRGVGPHALKAIDLLDEVDREWIASDMLRLEVIPKPQYYQRSVELAYYEAYFANVTTFVETTPALVQAAEAEAKTAGLNAADALLITSAKHAGATEFITAEVPTKPMFRVSGINVISIR